VCDATAGDYFNGKYGFAVYSMKLTIEGGRLTQVECARRDLEREFWEYCHTDENSDRVGELAFGTNLGLSEMIGSLLQDEKFPEYTSHLAIPTEARPRRLEIENARGRTDTQLRRMD